MYTTSAMSVRAENGDIMLFKAELELERGVLSWVRRLI